VVPLRGIYTKQQFFCPTAQHDVRIEIFYGRTARQTEVCLIVK
jgi:hypothetical protein